MNHTVDPSTGGLAAYYRFEQGIAGGNNSGVTTLDDLTSNSNDGTLNNLALNGSTSNWVASIALEGGGNGGGRSGDFIAAWMNDTGNQMSIEFRMDMQSSPSTSGFTVRQDDNTMGISSAVRNSSNYKIINLNLSGNVSETAVITINYDDGPGSLQGRVFGFHGKDRLCQRIQWFI